MRLPTGVPELVKMLDAPEVVRNEAVLVLTKLVAGNPEAQKVAAFSGCLEKLFNIVRYVSIRIADCIVRLIVNTVRS